jgi:aminoglycoside phosphotransferase (APT) family kinase protein
MKDVGSHIDDRSWDLARQLLPGLELANVTSAVGADHSVLIAPEVGVVRLSRQSGTVELMRRRRELLLRLEILGLPFALPTPISEVIESDGICAMAMRWIPGSPYPKGTGDPTILAGVLNALRQVEVSDVFDVVEPAHAYAGGERWVELMLDAVEELPHGVRSEALRRIEAAQALSSVEPSFIHGDLGGSNMFWDKQGGLVGIIDWDWASVWDPAMDAACLSWHGWDVVQAVVDTETYRRARIWYLTFPIEQLVAARLRPPGHPDVVNRAVSWILRTS